MSSVFVERDLAFEFDDQWTPTLEWDKHAAYRHGINEIDHGRAVDYLGMYAGRALYFIEVKDYRVHRRTKPIEPWLELESKVRNTVAGLLGACRREEHAGECAPFVDAIRNPGVELKIVFWYETPSAGRCSEPNAAKRGNAGALIAMRRVKTYVKWLGARVLSTQRAEDYQMCLPGLVVTSLARARRSRADAILKTFADRKLDVSEEIRRRIESCLDVKELERWLQSAAEVDSAAALFSVRR